MYGMRKFVGEFFLASACCLSFCLAALGAQSPAKIDIKQLGPQVGEKAPDFDLQDQSGKRWSRDTVMGPKGAVLVFYRSADW